MVTRQEIRERMIRLASEITKIPLDEITDAASIDDELRRESVDFIELQVALEEEYEIEIDPIQVLQLNELGLIVDYVYRQVARGNGGLPN